MLKQVDGKIGIREYFAVVVFCIASKASDNTPTLLLKTGENATWLLCIISGIIAIFPNIIILSLLKSYKDKNLIEIIYLVFGKYLGFIFSLILAAAIFASLTINTRSTVNILNIFYFPNTPPLINYAVLVGVSWFIANRGFEAIGRASLLFLPYAILSILLLMASVYKELNLSSIYPIAGPGAANLLKGGFLYSSVFYDIIFFSLFFPFTRTYKDFAISTFLGLLFSIATVSLFCFTASSLYGYTELNLLNYPFQTLARASHIGTYVNNIDAIYLIMWVIGITLHFAIYLYALAVTIGYMFKFYDFEKLLIPCVLIIPVIGIIPKNNIQVTFVLRDLLLKSASFFYFIFPFILFFISKLRGGNKN